MLLPESMYDSIGICYYFFVGDVIGMTRPAHHTLLQIVITLHLQPHSFQQVVNINPRLRRLVHLEQRAAFFVEHVVHVVARPCAHHAGRAVPVEEYVAAPVPVLVQPAQQRQVAREGVPVVAFGLSAVVLLKRRDVHCGVLVLVVAAGFEHSMREVLAHSARCARGRIYACRRISIYHVP